MTNQLRNLLQTYQGLLQHSTDMLHTGSHHVAGWLLPAVACRMPAAASGLTIEASNNIHYQHVPAHQHAAIKMASCTTPGKHPQHSDGGSLPTPTMHSRSAQLHSYRCHATEAHSAAAARTDIDVWKHIQRRKRRAQLEAVLARQALRTARRAGSAAARPLTQWATAVRPSIAISPSDMLLKQPISMEELRAVSQQQQSQQHVIAGEAWQQELQTHTQDSQKLPDQYDLPDQHYDLQYSSWDAAAQQAAHRPQPLEFISHKSSPVGADFSIDWADRTQASRSHAGMQHAAASGAQLLQPSAAARAAGLPARMQRLRSALAAKRQVWPLSPRELTSELSRAASLPALSRLLHPLLLDAQASSSSSSKAGADSGDDTGSRTSMAQQQHLKNEPQKEQPRFNLRGRAAHRAIEKAGGLGVRSLTAAFNQLAWLVVTAVSRAEQQQQIVKQGIAHTLSTEPDAHVGLEPPEAEPTQPHSILHAILESAKQQLPHDKHDGGTADAAQQQHTASDSIACGVSSSSTGIISSPGMTTTATAITTPLDDTSAPHSSKSFVAGIQPAHGHALSKDQRQEAVRLHHVLCQQLEVVGSQLDVRGAANIMWCLGRLRHVATPSQTALTALITRLLQPSHTRGSRNRRWHTELERSAAHAEPHNPPAAVQPPAVLLATATPQQLKELVMGAAWLQIGSPALWQVLAATVSCAAANGHYQQQPKLLAPTLWALSQGLALTCANDKSKSNNINNSSTQPFDVQQQDSEHTNNNNHHQHQQQQQHGKEDGSLHVTGTHAGAAAAVSAVLPLGQADALVQVVCQLRPRARDSPQMAMRDLQSCVTSLMTMGCKLPRKLLTVAARQHSNARHLQVS